MKSNIKLTNNSKIFVIGGGPAGSFFSYIILKLAKEKGLNIELTILEGKLFSRSGPHGCNYCAGVISETLIDRMGKIGLVLPQEIARSTVEGYNMITSKGELFLAHPLKRKKIVTVFRGNGPLFSNITENISFDDFLLREAMKIGAKVIYKRVSSISLPSNYEEKILITTEDNEHFEADFIVGAFGLNTELMEKVKNMGFGYKPPKVLKTCQTELNLGSQFVEEKFKNSIYIFNMGVKGLRFSAIIPKGEFITITLIGKSDLVFSRMEKFLNAPFMKKFLPEDWTFPSRHCHCLPRIPLTAAKKPYTHRFAIIGDACCSRYYKNGLESALITAKILAETVIDHGISEDKLKIWFWKRAKKIIYDNYFGRILFFLNDLISRFDFIVESHLKIANSNKYPSSILKDILWNMFTGNIEYKKIFLKIINPFFLFPVLLSGIFILLKNILRKPFK